MSRASKWIGASWVAGVLVAGFLGGLVGGPLLPVPAWAQPREAAKPPAPGMVWVDLDSALRLYYKEGHPLYGRTANGKFMTEADALKAGYRAAQN